jgi:hypothetical protein
MGKALLTHVLAGKIQKKLYTHCRTLLKNEELMLNIKKISSADKNFSEILQKHISQRKLNSSGIQSSVKNIIN